MNLNEVAHELRSLDMFPFFDIANSIKVTMMVRASLGPKFNEYSTAHPITCWITTILSQSVGGIISNVLLGSPALSVFTNPYKLGASTIIWFLIFYSTDDFFYRWAKPFPVALTYSALAEVHRAQRIFAGVSAAAAVYPASYIVMILIGTIRGNGKNALTIMGTIADRLKSPPSSNTVQMVPWTKFGFLAALLFTLSRLYAANEIAFKDAFPRIPSPPIFTDLVYLAVVIIFEIFMLMTLFKPDLDPFKPLSYFTRLALSRETLEEKKKMR